MCARATRPTDEKKISLSNFTVPSIAGPVVSRDQEFRRDWPRGKPRRGGCPGKVCPSPRLACDVSWDGHPWSQDTVHRSLLLVVFHLLIRVAMEAFFRGPRGVRCGSGPPGLGSNNGDDGVRDGANNGVLRCAYLHESRQVGSLARVHYAIHVVHRVVSITFQHVSAVCVYLMKRTIPRRCGRRRSQKKSQRAHDTDDLCKTQLPWRHCLRSRPDIQGSRTKDWPGSKGSVTAQDRQPQSQRRIFCRCRRGSDGCRTAGV